MSPAENINIITTTNTLSDNGKITGVHLKGLNGIRAIAAISVVCSHTGLALGEFGFSTFWSSNLAGFGVSIFFSLSGFLITYLLLMEKLRYNRINIKAFYARRILRIWPLYYFYLLLVVITLYFVRPGDLSSAFLFYVILFANIPFAFNFSIPLLTHYWSLAVEEQFYLFWPWLVKNPQRLFRRLMFFTFVFIVVKLCLRYIGAVTGYHWPYVFIEVTRFDCMIIGGMAAILYYEKNKFFFHILFSPFSQILAWCALVFMAINKFHIASVIDSDIVAIIAVILIVNVSANDKTLINLENPVFDFLGKISYGIYVYHPLVIFLTARFAGSLITPLGDELKLVILFTFIPICTVFIAFLSYNFFESKFLSLKLKYSLVKSFDSGFRSTS